MPNGTYGGVRGWGCEAPAYSMGESEVLGMVLSYFSLDPLARKE
jgi:hypothetical protein